MALDQSFFREMEARIWGKVRTRFRPSPTGYMRGQSADGPVHLAHRGTPAARSSCGSRTPTRARLVESATDVIYRTMAGAALTHDEGPDVGGPVGLSSRSAGTCISRPPAGGKGAAYYCFCEGRIRGGRR